MGLAGNQSRQCPGGPGRPCPPPQPPRSPHTVSDCSQHCCLTGIGGGGNGAFCKKVEFGWNARRWGWEEGWGREPWLPQSPLSDLKLPHSSGTPSRLVAQEAQPAVCGGHELNCSPGLARTDLCLDPPSSTYQCEPFVPQFLICKGTS